MTQTIARVFGVVFLLVGLLGFVTTPFSLEGGLLLGLFPVNVLHNLVHLVFGVWGLVAGRHGHGARPPTAGSPGSPTSPWPWSGSWRRRGSASCRWAGTTSGSTRSSASSWRPAGSLDRTRPVAIHH